MGNHSEVERHSTGRGQPLSSDQQAHSSAQQLDPVSHDPRIGIKNSSYIEKNQIVLREAAPEITSIHHQRPVDQQTRGRAAKDTTSNRQLEKEAKDRHKIEANINAAAITVVEHQKLNTEDKTPVCTHPTANPHAQQATAAATINAGQTPINPPSAPAQHPPDQPTR